MSQVFATIWSFLNYDFIYHGITFSLWNVIEASIVLSILGMFIGKVIFFVNEKR